MAVTNENKVVPYGQFPLNTSRAKGKPVEIGDLGPSNRKKRRERRSAEKKERTERRKAASIDRGRRKDPKTGFTVI